MSTPWKVFDHNGKHRISACNATDAALFLYTAGGEGWKVREREHGRDTSVWWEGKDKHEAYQGQVDLVASNMYSRVQAYEVEHQRRAEKSFAKFKATYGKGIKA